MVTSQTAKLSQRGVRHAPGQRDVRRGDERRTGALLAGEDTRLVSPNGLGLRRLATLLGSYTPHDGAFQLRVPGTWAVRLSRLTTEASYATMGPALCVAAQGSKAIMLGREVLEYDPAQLLVFAVDLPVSSQVTRASRKDPYLSDSGGRARRSRLPAWHSPNV
jgi:hypothetical protein